MAISGLVSILLSLAASAPPSIEKTRAEWQGHPEQEVVVELAQSWRILVNRNEYEKWATSTEQGVLSELLAGANAVPGELLSADTPAIHLRFHTKKMPMGMGDGSGPYPDFKHNQLHLFRWVPATGDRADYRLEALSASKRHLLWRRRAAIHAIIRRADVQSGWSRQPAWLLLNGWDDAGKAALNVDEYGYSRERGMDSAHLDLATFAEEYFIAAYDLDAGGLPANDSLFCQEFSKIRFLEEQLHVAAPGWQRSFPQGRPTCQYFEEWLDWENLAGLEVVLAAASSRKVESSFGHLYLHVARKKKSAPSHELYYQFRAVVGDDVSPLALFAHGIFGGFMTVLLPATGTQIRKFTVNGEHRTLRRFRLRLTERQRRLLMERLWESERRHIYHYRFFSQNCASAVLDFVAPVLTPPKRISHAGIWPAPNAVLAGLARKNLIDYAPPDMDSDQEAAIRASRALAEIEKQLAPLLPSQMEDYLRFASKLRSFNPKRRIKAHLDLKRWAIETIGGAKASPGKKRIVKLIIRAAELRIRIERYVFNLAKERHRKSLAKPKPPKDSPATTAKLLALRRRLYRREIPMWERAHLANQLFQDYQRRLQAENSANKQPATPRRVRLAQQSLVQSSTVLGELIDRFQPNRNSYNLLRKEQQDVATQADLDQASTTSDTPDLKMRVSSGVMHSAGESTPVLTLDAAMFEQQLGEQRSFATNPNTALTILRAQTDLAVDQGSISIRRVHLRIVGTGALYHSVAAANKSWLDVFSKNYTLDVLHDPQFNHALMLRSSSGVRLAVLHSRRAKHFLTVSFNLLSGGVRGQGNHRAFLGGEFALDARIHLSGKSLNALRLGGSIAAYQTLMNEQGGWDFTGWVHLEQLLFEPMGTPLSLFIRGELRGGSSLVSPNTETRFSVLARAGFRF